MRRAGRAPLLTPPVMPSARPARRASPHGTTSRSSLALRSQRAIPDPKAPSIDKSSGELRALARTLRRPPLLPVLGRTGAASRHVLRGHFVSARPSLARLFASLVRATCRSSTSAVEMIVEHTYGRTKLRHSRGGKPPLVGRQHRSSSRNPKPAPTAGLSTGQGPALPSGRAFGNPPERPLAQLGLTPTRSTQTPVSSSRDAGRMEARPATPVR